MFDNLNNIKFLLKYSRKCKDIIEIKAQLHKKQICCLFLDLKEVSNLLLCLQMKKRCNKKQYDVARKMIPNWIKNEKIIFYQAYNPKNPIEEKELFVIVM